MIMKNGIATIVVLLVLAGVPSLVWVYQKFCRPLHYAARVIDITGVGAAGAWTLERVSGLNYWWKPFEPATIHLWRGEQVVLRFQSADVFHQFYAPALGLGPVDVDPGHTREIGFKAEKSGVFQYYCTSMCGNCHFYMQGWIVVTPAGEKPVSPRPITCSLCLPDADDPGDKDLAVQGEYLYRAMGCVTCHGIAGNGGVQNYNYIKETVPAHNQTAAKLFLTDEEDRRMFLARIRQEADPGDVNAWQDISRPRLVLDRFNAAVALIEQGKAAARLDMNGPDPPLHMPAWRNSLSRKQIHSIMAYFISLTEEIEEQEVSPEV